MNELGHFDFDVNLERTEFCNKNFTLRLDCQQISFGT